jgi:hypothetical protein
MQQRAFVALEKWNFEEGIKTTTSALAADSQKTPFMW